MKRYWDAVVWLGATLGGLAGLTVLYFRDPHGSGSYPSCPFLHFTGLYCPGCGSMRATYCLLHGDFHEAVNRNILAVALLPIAAWAFAVDVENKWLKKQRLPRLPLWTPKVLLVVVLVYWAARNLPWAGFRWLAPH